MNEPTHTCLLIETEKKWHKGESISQSLKKKKKRRKLTCAACFKYSNIPYTTFLKAKC